MTTADRLPAAERDELVAQLQLIERAIRRLETSVEHNANPCDAIEQAVAISAMARVVNCRALTIYASHLLTADADTESAAATIPRLVARGSRR